MASSAKTMATTNEHLPEDVTLQILYFLSVKPLLRFSCTSKRWRSIITSPQFAKTHFKLASQRNTLTQRLLLSAPSCLQSLDLQTPSFVDSSCISNLTCPFKRPLPEKSIKMLGSCNGMVCVALDEMDKYYIWNPSTSMFLRLPNPGFAPYEEYKFVSLFTGVRKMRRDYVRLHSGFGYVSATDDYKVVFAASFTDGGSKNLEIFSCRANSWKTMEPSGDLPYDDYDRKAALSNEALHWITSTYHYERGIVSYAIVTFDLAKEEFGNMPLPLIEDNEDGEREFNFIEDVGVVLGGCLCVSGFYAEYKSMLVQVWVMMEYGVPESWTKLFQLSMVHDGYTMWRPVFHTDSSTVFRRRKPWNKRTQRDGNELIRFNHVHKDDADCSGRYNIGAGLLGMIEYDETLLWLDDRIGVEENSKRLGTQHGASTSRNVDV